jgi:serine/threonine protein phosphatase PrpC
VPDERIAQLLASGAAESVAQSLIDAALEGGGSDNVTVIVARAT